MFCDKKNFFPFLLVSQTKLLSLINIHTCHLEKKDLESMVVNKMFGFCYLRCWDSAAGCCMQQ